MENSSKVDAHNLFNQLMFSVEKAAESPQIETDYDDLESCVIGNWKHHNKIEKVKEVLEFCNTHTILVIEIEFFKEVYKYTLAWAQSTAQEIHSAINELENVPEAADIKLKELLKVSELIMNLPDELPLIEEVPEDNYREWIDKLRIKDLSEDDIESIDLDLWALYDDYGISFGFGDDGTDEAEQSFYLFKVLLRSLKLVGQMPMEDLIFKYLVDNDSETSVNNLSLETAVLLLMGVLKVPYCDTKEAVKLIYIKDELIPYLIR